MHELDDDPAREDWIADVRSGAAAAASAGRGRAMRAWREASAMPSLAAATTLGRRLTTGTNAGLELQAATREWRRICAAIDKLLQDP